MQIYDIVWKYKTYVCTRPIPIFVLQAPLLYPCCKQAKSAYMYTIYNRNSFDNESKI